MSAMTYEEYRYDESLQDCFHDCIRCGKEAGHVAPASYDGCEAVLLCDSCEIDTRACVPFRCAYVIAENGGHHWRCPARDLEEI